MKIIYLADYLYEDGILGGGEINDHELCSILGKEYEIEKIKCKDFSQKPETWKKTSGNFFIISNFAFLSEKAKDFIKRKKYIIYEHDHKYLVQRNPGLFKDLKAPEDQIINKDFYEKARAIICQSQYHVDIVKNNLQINNLVNISGNLWSEKALNKMEQICNREKEDKCSIVNASVFHKSTKDSKEYCEKREWEYELMHSQDYYKFLELLGSNKKLVFLPKAPETLSRVVVEARMMGMSVLTNDKVGATGEPWFKVKGASLIEVMRGKREEIKSRILGLISIDESKKKVPKVSIITSLYRGQKYIERFLCNIISQTYFQNCELIIVDANSPENEYKTIEKYQKKYKNIRYFKLKEDPGIYGCWNYGIEKSKYDLITNANLDDLRSPEQIEKFALFLERNKDIDLLYSECYATSLEQEVYIDGKDYGNVYPTYSFSKEAMIKCLPGCMPMWRKSIHTKAGYFNEEYKSAGDHEMWLRAVDSGSVFWKYPGIHGLYYNNPDGVSTSTENQDQRFQEEKNVFWKYCHVFGEKVKRQYEGYFSQ